VLKETQTPYLDWKQNPASRGFHRFNRWRGNPRADWAELFALFVFGEGWLWFDPGGMGFGGGVLGGFDLLFGIAIVGGRGLR
jgi:hypothetical protein